MLTLPVVVYTVTARHMMPQRIFANVPITSMYIYVHTYIQTYMHMYLCLHVYEYRYSTAYTVLVCMSRNPVDTDCYMGVSKIHNSECTSQITESPIEGPLHKLRKPPPSKSLQKASKRVLHHGRCSLQKVLHHGRCGSFLWSERTLKLKEPLPSKPPQP